MKTIISIAAVVCSSVSFGAIDSQKEFYGLNQVKVSAGMAFAESDVLISEVGGLASTIEYRLSELMSVGIGADALEASGQLNYLVEISESLTSLSFFAKLHYQNASGFVPYILAGMARHEIEYSLDSTISEDSLTLDSLTGYGVDLGAGLIYQLNRNWDLALDFKMRSFNDDLVSMTNVGGSYYF